MKKLFILSILALLTSFLNAQTHWTAVDPSGSTGNTATIIAVVEFEGAEQHSNQLEVGVFHGDECRGTGLASTVYSGRYYVYLSVFGINGEADSFKVYDHASNSELDMTCSQTYTYQDNSMTGSIPSPLVLDFLSNHFVINASAKPSAGGSVLGAGTYDRDAAVTLSATANSGYSFVEWTKDDTQVSTSASYSFTATVATAGDYVAHFSLNSYAITVSANPTAGGTVTGANTYDHGATATLTATANTGYTFVNWTKGGVVVSTNPTYSFTVTGAGAYVANFSLNSDAITATANPTAGGTVTGANTYHHGATATLKATANTGYTFVNWTKGGVVVSTNPTYSFTVTGAGAYVANFSLNSYSITVSANPTAGGTVTGANTYNHGATATLKATANTGYTFVNWTKDGVVVSTNATYSFTVTEAGAYVANFSLNSYSITVSANPTAGGTVTGANTYNHGATATLTATANTGYTFVNWTKDGVEVSTNATYSFTVTEAGAYVANFVLNGYAITATANPTAGGTVTGASTYSYGTTATLKATANTGYTFVNWTKGGVVVSTNPTYSFTVTGAGAYVANFSLNSYSITVSANPTAGGTVTGANTYNHGATATLTATANTGYTFVNWTKGGVEVSTNATYSFTVTEAGAYVANFSLNNYAITATCNPTGGGVITGAGNYNHGETCTLSVATNPGYTFINWTKDGVEVSTSTTYGFTVTGAGAYVANFSVNGYEITATANPTAGGDITGAGVFTYGQTCTLTTTVNTGYTFVNWTKEGVEVSTNLSFSFTVTEAGAYVANFSLNSYAITATANPTTGGTVTGAGTYNHFETCTLNATANTGYTFVNWTKEGVEVSTNPSISFTVEGAASYVANFSLNSYVITAMANPTAGGTVTGAGTYNHFETCTLTATPAYTYAFVNWTKDGVVVSTEPTYTFTVTETGAYVANFSLSYVDIEVNSAEPSFGTVSGGGTYLVGSTCTLTATPYEGFRFVNWVKNHQIVSSNAVYSFTVTEGGSYIAFFERIPYSITAEANPVEGGTIEGTGDLFYNNTTCQLIATANEGYRFVNWIKDGVVVSTDDIYEFAVTGPAHFIANFTLVACEITAEADPEEGGSVTGAGTYNYGETVTMTATPNVDFRFENWTIGDEVVSEESEYTFTAEQNMHLVAHFVSTVSINESDELAISVYPNPVVDKLMVKSQAPIRQCEVYSITGQCMLRQKDCGEMFEIKVSELLPGSYLIRLAAENFVEFRKFVKE